MGSATQRTTRDALSGTERRRQVDSQGSYCRGALRTTESRMESRRSQFIVEAKAMLLAVGRYPTPQNSRERVTRRLAGVQLVGRARRGAGAAARTAILVKARVLRLIA